MKNFKYPFIIRGTAKQLQELRLKLINLGYSSYREEVLESSNVLVTNDVGWTGILCDYDASMLNKEMKRTEVSASNPDLVLALAAMVNDGKFYKGEIVKANLQIGGQFTKGALYTIALDQQPYSHVLVTKDDSGNGDNGLHHVRWIKATKEEIVNHFTKKIHYHSTDGSLKELPVGINGQQIMEKKIIGYKLKDDCKQYTVAACKIEGYRTFGEGIKNGDPILFIDETYPSIRRQAGFDRLAEAGVLDLWFEPVYEENEFKVGDWVTHIGNWSNSYDGLKTYKVKQITQTGLSRFIYVDWAACPRANDSYSSFRLATPEEIEAAQTKTITLSCTDGIFEIEVSKKGIYYRPEKKYLNSERLKYIVNHNPWKDGYNIDAYTFTPIVTHIDSGCKKRVSIEDWKKVIEAYEAIIK